MSSSQYKNQKKPLNVSKNEINNAAREIRHGCNGDGRLIAIKKVQAFREYHLYPLMLIKNHLARNASKISDKIIVARRLKRLSTIIDKLERPTLDGTSSNSIKLTRMQDLAGCRAIVKNLSQLIRLREKLETSRSVHKIVSIKDYLSPKKSGYGGVHIVFSCYENQDEEHDWRKAKVEVQLRTELHHAWATSLEIIDTLEQINLKTSHDGHEQWRRFFSVAGQLVAHEEKACVIEDDERLSELRHELVTLNHELEVSSKLARYSFAIRMTTNKNSPKQGNAQGLFLVKMMRPKPNDKTLPVEVNFFSMRYSNEALEALNAADLDEEVLIAVMVSAQNVRTLKQAYPNYFGSTRKFSEFLKKQKAYMD